LGSTGYHGFTIETPLISLEIALKELASLHIHEEIIPEKMLELVAKMPGDGVFLHPIIVDSQSLVVLDGMHRIAAAKEIGFRYIPVCFVDYANPHIQIGCWYRMFGGLRDAFEVEPVFRSEGMTPTSQPYEVAYGLVEGRKAVTAAFSRDWCLTATAPVGDIKERYEIIKRIETRLQGSGHPMGYSTDRDALSKIDSGEFSVGLMTPTVAKMEVVNTALASKVFSQKTTRHIIPARPMNVNVPIAWLRGYMSLDEANTRLRHHLESRRIDKLPPGQILDRRYDEELYVFK
jgi:hypothetical protein